MPPVSPWGPRNLERVRDLAMLRYLTNPTCHVHNSAGARAPGPRAPPSPNHTSRHHIIASEMLSPLAPHVSILEQLPQLLELELVFGERVGVLAPQRLLP